MTRARKRFVAAFTLALLASGLLLFGPAWGDEKKEGTAPPKGAQVLFDGKDLSGWETLGGQPAEWTVQDGYVEVVPGKGDVRTKETFGPDFKVHVEFWLPLMEDKKSQERSNSGVYLQGRYEIQVLDNYMNDTYEKGWVGAMYGILEPDHEAMKKAIKKPEEWNAYDITFHSPRVDDDGKVKEPGRVTVALNGVTIIDDGKFDHVTGGAMDDKVGTPGPMRLQDHGCKVRYRNIWLKPLAEK